MDQVIQKETKKVSELHNWEKNPRSINKKDFERLKKQIQELGQYKPLLVTQDGEVIGGNMRLRAYKELGIDDIWVSVVTPKDDAEKLKYALSDNDRAGFYDEDLIANLIPDYPDFDWSQYAVDIKAPQSLDDLIQSLTPVEEDEVPEVAEGEPESKLGEVYELGRHRLMCGDSTKLADVEELCNSGGKVDLIVTDPPYNTGMKPKADSSWMSHVFNDSFTDEEYRNLLQQSLQNMYKVAKGECAFYVFIDWRKVGLLKDEMETILPVHNVIVWDKIVHGLGSDYKFTYEMCVVGKKGKPEINNRIGSDFQDIWRVQRTMGRNEDHATAKPIELLKKPILHASKQDDIVLDLFGGSGSTLIACEQTNRTCYMMEIDPKYCDVIRKRYTNFTQK